MKASLWMLAILFCTILQLSTAIIVKDKDVTTSLQGGILTSFQTFGYQKGGNLSFVPAVKYADRKLALAVCTRSQWTTLISLKDQFSSLCNPHLNETVLEYDGVNYTYVDYFATRNVCELTSVSLLSPLLQDYEVLQKEQYTLALINCDAHRTIQKVSLSYTMRQPDGNHLSLGTQENEIIYKWLGFFWLVIILLLLMEMLFLVQLVRRTLAPDEITTPSNLEAAALAAGYKGMGLHLLLVIVLFLKFWDVNVVYHRWDQLASVGEVSLYLDLLGSLLFATSECAFFCLLLLVAKGWRITRYQLHTDESRETSYAFIIPLCTLLFFSVYNDGYYFLSMMLLYFFLLPKIFHSIHLNLNGLQTRLIIVEDWLYHAEDMDSDEENEARAALMLAIKLMFDCKYSVFHVLKKAILTYLVAIFVCNCVKVLIPWEYDWINTIFSESVDACMILVMAYLIQPLYTRMGLFFLSEGTFLLR